MVGSKKMAAVYRLWFCCTSSNSKNETVADMMAEYIVIRRQKFLYFGTLTEMEVIA